MAATKTLFYRRHRRQWRDGARRWTTLRWWKKKLQQKSRQQRCETISSKRAKKMTISQLRYVCVLRKMHPSWVPRAGGFASWRKLVRPHRRNQKSVGRSACRRFPAGAREAFKLKSCQSDVRSVDGPLIEQGVLGGDKIAERRRTPKRKVLTVVAGARCVCVCVCIVYVV
jgi:hypothetical protein